MNENSVSNTEAALAAGRALGTLQLVILGSGAPLAVIPKDYKAEIINIEQVEKYLPKPFRKKGTFKMGDADSFIRFFNEGKNEQSRIFAQVDDTGGIFRGVLNFQGDEPSFNDHVVTFQLEQTLEWKRWMTQNKARMSQVEFATFLEENTALFVEPKGADLLELIQTLDGKSNVSVSQAIKLQNGQLKVNYDEEVELKGASTTQAGTMTLPTILNVGIAPFQGTKPYAIKARLRYRIESRKITFWYETIDAHSVVREVCKQVVDLIVEKTGQTPFAT